MAGQADLQVSLATPEASPLQRTQNAGMAIWTFFRRYPRWRSWGRDAVAHHGRRRIRRRILAHDPLYVDFLSLGAAPSATYLLGTDYEGRDILSRIIYGGRVSLQVSVLSVLLGSTVGALWGIASAFLGGRSTLSANASSKSLCHSPLWFSRWFSW